MPPDFSLFSGFTVRMICQEFFSWQEGITCLLPGTSWWAQSLSESGMWPVLFVMHSTCLSFAWNHTRWIIKHLSIYKCFTFHNDLKHHVGLWMCETACSLLEGHGCLLLDVLHRYECKANACMHAHTYRRMNNYDKQLPNRYLYNAEIATIFTRWNQFSVLASCSLLFLCYYFCRTYIMKLLATKNWVLQKTIKSRQLLMLFSI